MEYRLLGRTGIRVSSFCLGVMNFGGKVDQDEADAMIDHAIASGINFIDTANVYNQGRSEQLLGQALKHHPQRQHIVIATKCHGNMFKGNDLNPNRWGNSRRQIIQQCEASLERLQVDAIDLYQIHRPHVDCPIDETLRAFDDLVRSGKVRYIGCSTFAAWQVVESLWVADHHHLNRFVTEQPPYNLLDRRIERELIPMCQTYGLGIIPWSPLAGGFLTGKYQRDAGGPADSRYGQTGHARSDSLLNNSRAFDVVEGLQQLADNKNVNLGQFALAWCMHQPGITSPIIGPRSRAQLQDNLGALDCTLDQTDHDTIDQLIPPGEHVAPFYNAAFGPHTHRAFS